MYDTYNILIQLFNKGGIVYTEHATTESDAIEYAKKLISKYGSTGDQVFIWRVDTNGNKYYYNSENKDSTVREPWCIVN
jgi:glucan-binding YG repeat protein